MLTTLHQQFNPDINENNNVAAPFSLGLPIGALAAAGTFGVVANTARSSSNYMYNNWNWFKKTADKNKLPINARGWAANAKGFGKAQLAGMKFGTDAFTMNLPFRTTEGSFLDKAFDREAKAGNKIVRSFRERRAGWKYGNIRSPKAKEYLSKNKFLKGSFGAAASLFMINSELEEDGTFRGLFTGGAKEVSSIAGSILGGTVGPAAGALLSGGWTGAAFAGGVLGAGIGAIAGYAAVDAVINASRLGRRWSIPDVAGGFRDSQDSMTMRARSLNAIRTSQFNTRSELGNEAIRLNMNM